MKKDTFALVQSKRNTKAVGRLMRKLLKKHGEAPRIMVTDNVKSYAAPKKKLSLRFDHRQHKGLNNRAENSHQPTRVRVKVMSRYKPTCHPQRFLSVHDQAANLFMHCRSRDAKQKRELRILEFAIWYEEGCTEMATT